MAIATKTELNQTTALTDATIAAIAPPADYAKQATQAFTDLAEGERRLGSADQRMAYAILCHAMQLILDESTGHRMAVAAMRTDARTYLMSKMRAKFIQNRPAPKRDDVTKRVEPTTHVMREAQVVWDKRNALLVRAFELAHCLALNNITYNQFAVKTGVFTVPGRQFVFADDEISDLLGSAKGNVPMNAGALAYMVKTGKGKNDTGLRQIQASVTQYLNANKPAPAPRAARASAAATAEVSATEIVLGLKPETLATAVVNNGLPAIETLFNTLVIAVVGDSDGTLPKRSDYTQAIWQAWGKLSDMYHKAQAAKGYDDGKFATIASKVDAAKKPAAAKKAA